MTARAGAKWVALALVGVAIAIGVAIAATNLTSQQIGIANESASAGDVLAPSLRTPEEQADTGKGKDHEKTTPQEETPTTTPEEPTTTPEETIPPTEGQEKDDSGGGGSDD